MAKFVLNLNGQITKGAIHKGRLLKGVGRWVHQKEIYITRLFSKNRRQGYLGRWGQKNEIGGVVFYGWSLRVNNCKQVFVMSDKIY